MNIRPTRTAVAFALMAAMLLSDSVASAAAEVENAEFERLVRHLEEKTMG